MRLLKESKTSLPVCSFISPYTRSVVSMSPETAVAWSRGRQVDGDVWPNGGVGGSLHRACTGSLHARVAALGMAAHLYATFEQRGQLTASQPDVICSCERLGGWSGGEWT